MSNTKGSEMTTTKGGSVATNRRGRKKAKPTPQPVETNLPTSDPQGSNDSEELFEKGVEIGKSLVKPLEAGFIQGHKEAITSFSNLVSSQALLLGEAADRYLDQNPHLEIEGE